MDPTCRAKLDKLKRILRQTEGCAVAYSGGVDSSLLLTVAHEVLGDRSLAVIAVSSIYQSHESQLAVEFAASRGVAYVKITSDQLNIPGFSDNPPDRCYYCKKKLFSQVASAGRKRGLKIVADGTNADDVRDYRPGLRAAEELGVLSPLKQAGLTKKDIRTVARDVYNLPSADKPATVCLASRFPYGSKITADKLHQVEVMEQFLANRGFSEFRARHHGETLRLELSTKQMPRIFQPDIRRACIKQAEDLGFTYVAIDLKGYRSGSMNEVLERK